MLKRRTTIASAVGIAAAFCLVEVDPMTWYHEETASYSVGKEKLFNYVTEPSEVHEVRSI